MSIPNGGFPPIEKCMKQNKKLKKDGKKKFFYVPENTANISEILKKQKNVVDIRDENEEVTDEELSEA